MNEVVRGLDKPKAIRDAYVGLLERGAVPSGVRGVVADSWLRSVAAGVDADASSPPITLTATG